jgi:type II secretory pathway pseudopilin PulG
MNGLRSCRTKSSSSGFTLIEIAGLLLICSLLLVAGLSLVKTWMNQSTLAINQSRIAAIQQALASYSALNGRLPCPANYTDAQGSATFGRGSYIPLHPPYVCNTGAGTFAGIANPGVVIGAVPVRDLGLPDSFIADTYGYRFTYATTLAGAAGPVNSAASTINIKNTALATASTSTYVVVDHGSMGKGAYTIDGKAATACPGIGNDQYNCNKYASNYFIIAPFSNNLLLPGAWFDDTVVVSPLSQATCTVVGPVASPTNGSSWLGLGYWGHDSGTSDPVGIGFCPIIVGCVATGPYKDILNFGLEPHGFNTTAPIADAYCKDATYTVVTGGCTQVTTNFLDGVPWLYPTPYVFGADMDNIDSGPEPVMPPLSHPAMPDGAGRQGWECNGSSAFGIQTQAYAVCCSQGG